MRAAARSLPEAGNEPYRSVASAIRASAKAGISVSASDAFGGQLWAKSMAAEVLTNFADGSLRFCAKD